MAGYNDILLYENPNENPTRRKRRRRRNVAGAAALRGRLPGAIGKYVNASYGEILAATGGLAAATMVPSMLIKDTSTTLRKLSKLGVSLVAAVLTSQVAEGVSRGSGRAALLGGMAGAGVMTLGMFTNIVVGDRRLVAGTRTVNLGESRAARSQGTDEDIQISVT